MHSWRKIMNWTSADIFKNLYSLPKIWMPSHCKFHCQSTRDGLIVWLLNIYFGNWCRIHCCWAMRKCDATFKPFTTLKSGEVQVIGRRQWWSSSHIDLTFLFWTKNCFQTIGKLHHKQNLNCKVNVSWIFNDPHIELFRG